MFKPLNDRVLIKPDDVETTTPTGIILVTDKVEKPVTGVVVAGNATVKVGDRVLFSKFGYDEVTIEREVMYVVSPSTMLGIF